MRFKIPKRQPSSFRASALYLAGRTRGQSPSRVAWAETRNLETDDPNAAAAIMDATAAQNLRCKQSVYHFVLTFDPKDAKAGKVPPEVMREIAGEAIERLGLTEHQMLIYAHKDTEHPHMHFLVNRVHPVTGKAFDRHEDGKRLTRLCREIARERELNIPRDRARMLERERVDDFDDLGPPVSEGEYWQARREDRAPDKPLSKEEIKKLRDHIQGHFYNAKDWHDLSARLGAQGVFLQRKGQGLILVKGDRFAKLSQMGKGVRLKELEDRFGERFESWFARRVKELADHEVAEARPPGYENMTPAERRRAERLRQAKLDAARSKRDKVRELEEADFDYRYWSGVEAIYKATERRIGRLEKEKGWLEKALSKRETGAFKAGRSFADSMAKVFRDPEQAAKRWKRLEDEYGIEDAAQLVRDTPTVLGEMKGRHLLGKDSAERRKAKQAFRYLHTKRKRWRETQLVLGHHQGRIEENRRALRIAIRDFEALKLRSDVPYELRQIIHEKIQRREKALSRVTDFAIRESDIAEDRKQDLLRARERYFERRKELERKRERGFIDR